MILNNKSVKSINERIQLIIDQYFKGNVTAFGVEIGATQSTVRSIVKERGSKPSTQTINKILSASSLNINPAWLLTGEEPMLKTDTPNKSQTAECQECIKLKERLAERDATIEKLAEKNERLIEEKGALKNQINNLNHELDMNQKRNTA